MNGLEQDRRLLERLCEWTGFSPSRLGDEAGLSATTVSRPLSGAGTSRLSANTIDKLFARYPNFPGWTEYGVGKVTDQNIDFGGAETQPERLLPGSGSSKRRNKSAAPDVDMVEVANIDLNFGLGAALTDQEVTEQQAAMLPFPREWMREIRKADPGQLYWSRGVGNSMEPAIGDGEAILIDRSAVGSSFGDLYWAIAYGQTCMIKRLRPMPDGSVKILSDNPNVPPEVAYDGELHVFGRVVAVVKRI